MFLVYVLEPENVHHTIIMTALEYNAAQSIIPCLLQKLQYTIATFAPIKCRHESICMLTTIIRSYLLGHFCSDHIQLDHSGKQ